MRHTGFFRFISERTTYIFIFLLFKSYRLCLELDDADFLDKHEGIYYFWHQQIVMAMFLFFALSRNKGACIVSPSSDGRLAGFICKKFGFSVLYGSPHKNPVKVLREALSILTKSGTLCLVGDGSRGPAYQRQQGLDFLSQKTGLPLIFIEGRASKEITFEKTWDKFKLPLPFSTITIRIHAPYYVCKSTST